MERIEHDLIQGSDEWKQYRNDRTRLNASEASAMLGLSPYVKRDELIKLYATGTEKEFSDYVQKYILDKGHEIEDATRPLVEEVIGESLYPVTYSYGPYSASCDGLTIGADLAWECKQWNSELVESVKNGVLPEHHMPQVQQVMMCTGAEKCVFTVSDGTNFESITIEADQNYFKKLQSAWELFEEDVANYTHIESEPEVIGKAPESLPALNIELTGMVTSSNLAEFKYTAIAVFENIKTDLQTDEDFANADKTVKWCGEVEKRLEAAKEHALSQTSSIDELFKTIDDIKEESRTTRLKLEKLVKARKESIRNEIILAAEGEFKKHIAKIDERLGRHYPIDVGINVATAIKGKRTIESLRNAANTELANAKLAANEVADKLQINLETLRTHAENHKFLFSDIDQVVFKDNDDLLALIKNRITEHEAAEQKKRDEEREKIRQEEAEKLRQEEATREAEKQEEPKLKPVNRPVEALKPEVKKPTALEKLKTATKGNDYGENNSQIATAGITIGDYVNAIEIHGESLEESQQIRDLILGLIDGLKE